MPGYRSTYTETLALQHEVLSDAGHITIEDGFGPWPSMFDRYQRDGDQPDRDPEAPSRSSIFSISCEQNSKARSGAWRSIRSGVSVER